MLSLSDDTKADLARWIERRGVSMGDVGRAMGAGGSLRSKRARVANMLDPSAPAMLLGTIERMAAALHLRARVVLQWYARAMQPELVLEVSNAA